MKFVASMKIEMQKQLACHTESSIYLESFRKDVPCGSELFLQFQSSHLPQILHLQFFPLATNVLVNYIITNYNCMNESRNEVREVAFSSYAS